MTKKHKNKRQRKSKKKKKNDYKTATSWRNLNRDDSLSERLPERNTCSFYTFLFYFFFPIVHAMFIRRPPPQKVCNMFSHTHFLGLAHHPLQRVPLMTPIFFLGADVWRGKKDNRLLPERWGRMKKITMYHLRRDAAEESNIRSSGWWENSCMNRFPQLFIIRSWLRILRKNSFP